MAELSIREMATEAATYVQTCTQRHPEVGLILGSGLGMLASKVCDPDTIPYSEIPHFPRANVPGHMGRLVVGRLSGSTVLVMQGRPHYYEGHSALEVSFPVRVMHYLGVHILIVTNAAGAIRRDLEVGSLMAITDHINLPGLAGHNPLRGPNEEDLGPRFPVMLRAYDMDLLQLLRREACEHQITLHEGTYAMVGGPNYETPAEVRFLRIVGADAVGMSTVPEVIVARHMGMRVLGISVISNIAVDSLRADGEETSHEEVLEAGERVIPTLGMLIEGLLRRLDRQSG